MLVHGRHPCNTCPFRRESPEGHFLPEVLDETVGKNIRDQEYAHRCHKTLGGPRENVCVGFLRHVRDHGIPNRLVAMGLALGIIDYDQVSDEVPIGDSWEEVLAIHRARVEAEGAE